MPPLISKEEMDVMDSGDESDDETMYTKMLADICDGRQSHLSVDRREARYKICDSINKNPMELKTSLLFTQNMGKGLHKVFKAILNYISQVLPVLGESGSEFS